MHLRCLFGYLAVASAAATVEQRPISLGSPPPYRDELLSLHKSLVSIPSVTGTEDGVAGFLIGWLESHSYSVETQRLPPLDNTPEGSTRLNVLAWPPIGSDESAGRHRHPRVLLTSHIDVVPPHIPYAIAPGPVTRHTTIRGRGSVDAKASVAAQIVALQALLRAGEVRARDAMLLFVVGEERFGDGMRLFNASSHAALDAVVFGEPTENKLACGHKGHAACEVRALGRAGHSGYPWLGKSATEVLVRALVRLLDADLGSSARFGNTTVNVGILQGGVAPNVIPKHASSTLALRIAAGDQQTGFGIVKERVEEILRETDESALSLECGNGYGPIECYCDVDGFDSMIANYGTDAANLDGDHVRYLYGPGSILVAHGDDEALTVGDLEDAVEGYQKLVKHALGV